MWKPTSVKKDKGQIKAKKTARSKNFMTIVINLIIRQRENKMNNICYWPWKKEKQVLPTNTRTCNIVSLKLFLPINYTVQQSSYKQNNITGYQQLSTPKKKIKQVIRTIYLSKFQKNLPTTLKQKFIQT